MPTASKALISQLQSDRRFMGTCPSCHEEFSIADAVLYAIRDQPPERAVVAIAEARQTIRERKDYLAKYRERMTTRAEKTAHAVNLGKMVEKIVPSFSSFTYYASDCRALFEPIDYVIFSGLSKAQVEALYFVDVKSGKARLTETQKNIKNIVSAGRLRFSTLGEPR